MGESAGKQKLADSTGKSAQVVSQGHKISNIEWTDTRLILSTDQLVIANSEGKRTVPLEQIQTLKSRVDLNQLITRVSGYISLEVGRDVLLISPSNVDQFKHRLFEALLNGQGVFGKHPAVRGGVVTDASWTRGHITIADEAVELVFSDGESATITLDEVSRIDRRVRQVTETSWPVIEVEHTDAESSVETFLSGITDRVCSLIQNFLQQGTGHAEVDVDLSSVEREVLVALHAGVSPFKIPQFVGVDIDEAERIYDRLIELDILEEVQTRKEVTLKASGRNIIDSTSYEK